MTSRRRASEDSRVDERRMALDGARVDRRPALRESAPLISRQTVSRRRDSILENRGSSRRASCRDLSGIDVAAGASILATASSFSFAIPLRRRPGRDPVTRTMG